MIEFEKEKNSFEKSNKKERSALGVAVLMVLGITLLKGAFFLVDSIEKEAKNFNVEQILTQETISTKDISSVVYQPVVSSNFEQREIAYQRWSKQNNDINDSCKVNFFAVLREKNEYINHEKRFCSYELNRLSYHFNDNFHIEKTVCGNEACADESFILHRAQNKYYLEKDSKISLETKLYEFTLTAKEYFHTIQLDGMPILSFYDKSIADKAVEEIQDAIK